MRDRRFNMMLSETEARWLESIAKADGISLSDVLRQLLRREYDAREARRLEQINQRRRRP
jgi:hypothetical protein